MAFDKGLECTVHAGMHLVRPRLQRQTPPRRDAAVGAMMDADGKLTVLDLHRRASRGQLPRGPNGLVCSLRWTLQQVADYLGMA